MTRVRIRPRAFGRREISVDRRRVELLETIDFAADGRAHVCRVHSPETRVTIVRFDNIGRPSRRAERDRRPRGVIENASKRHDVYDFDNFGPIECLHLFEVTFFLFCQHIPCNYKPYTRCREKSYLVVDQ